MSDMIPARARRFSLTAAPVFQDGGRPRTQHFAIFDSVSDFADACDHPEIHAAMADNARDWCGGLIAGAALDAMRRGDDSAVPASDALLSKFEDVEIQTSRKVWMADVAGPVANVPAYLAGTPLAMRRRTRVADTLAPLTIVAETTVSAGVPESAIRSRGVAVLALVRLLTTVRPVELYIAGSNCNRSEADKASIVLIKVDTSPLDVTRAAHLLTHPSVPRAVLYRAGPKLTIRRSIPTSGGATNWPWNSVDLVRRHYSDFVKPAFTDRDVFGIPGAYLDDLIAKDPVAWVRRMLAVHSDPSTYVDTGFDARYRAHGEAGA